MRSRSEGGRSDGGAVTAELAVLLPGVVLLLAAVLSAGTAAAAQVRCTDAAGQAARLAARDEAGDVVVRAATARAPGSTVTVRVDGGTVRVEVRSAVRLPLPGRPGLTVRAEAVAARESG
ncbi:TadE family type IV pilus minor pilin [Spongisporangium articulatum]|uniref:TadE family type IV pilus minor pilin n=1 Tax=Spongisporangium articulatum TaxID=3362603 RepID=A0ABW8AIX7_9ACTN